MPVGVINQVQWGTVGEWVAGLGAAAVAAVLGILAVRAQRRANALTEASLAPRFMVIYKRGFFTLEMITGGSVVIEALSKSRVLYREEDSTTPILDGDEEELLAASHELPRTLHADEQLQFIPSNTGGWAIAESQRIELITAQVRYRVVEGSPVRAVAMEVDIWRPPQIRSLG